MRIDSRSFRRKYPSIVIRRAVVRKIRRKKKVVKGRNISMAVSSIEKSDPFKKAMYGVEHALSMYATSYCTLPAEYIYEKELLAQYDSVIQSCHIYMIGYLPKADTREIYQSGKDLVIEVTTGESLHKLRWSLPEGIDLKEEDGLFYCEDQNGRRSFPPESEILRKLHLETGKAVFDVKYIGQAYGKSGSRNAIDRLLKHETLQKISLKGVPDGHVLSLLLLAVEPNNQLLTVMNPFAKNKDSDGERIKSGLDKLFNTNERERIALYEASLIRYFMPEYNKEFKNSFPSTNLKILQDCYNKDFSAVVAEICIDELPYNLKSETVAAKPSHIASHDLHKEEDRKVFFSL